MSHRSTTFKVVLASGLAYLAGVASTGREARSAPRLLADPAQEVKAYQHHAPFVIRIKKSDDTPFDGASVPTITYQDSGTGVPAAAWRPLDFRFSSGRRTMIITVRASDPRKTLSPVAAATGTGTIVVTTTTAAMPPAETTTGAMPANAVQNEDYQ